MTEKARLLVIDDNPGDVGLLKWALQQAGLEFDLQVIEDGGSALDLVRSVTTTPADLVILDLNLPKASGHEILAAMRASQAFERLPVVIWTSSNSPRDRSQLESLRIDRYLVKPPDLNEFLKLGVAIKEVLHR